MAGTSTPLSEFLEKCHRLGYKLHWQQGMPIFRGPPNPPASMLKIAGMRRGEIATKFFKCRTRVVRAGTSEVLWWCRPDECPHECAQRVLAARPREIIQVQQWADHGGGNNGWRITDCVMGDALAAESRLEVEREERISAKAAGKALSGSPEPVRVDNGPVPGPRRQSTLPGY